MAFRKQDMGTEYAHCPCSVIFCKPSQWTELENMFVYVVILKYIYIYIKLYSFCVYLFIYFDKQIHPGIFNKFSSTGLSLFSYPHF